MNGQLDDIRIDWITVDDIVVFFVVVNSLDSYCEIKNSEIAKIFHRPIREALTFPDPSTMGIFLALSIPLSPLGSVSVSYYFEQSYDLPNGSILISNSEKKNRNKRKIDRTSIYEILENKLDNSGYSGRACLLRSICEISEFNLDDNGIVGDILNVIFKPSTSQPEDLPQDILEAEFIGRVGYNDTCLKYHSTCPMGLFDMIGIFM
ncbi:uncharacterized protein LOC122861211 [Aphidius gifuensis]|uniref:uncharacterized protein LOC122861211 n=1 Tax=Aphidius gifuensis TaxID=684658 RepID=UPI001CDD67A7|nr:uncharacterized protein LOC122861211 [Aphidius gifuensis]